MPFNLFQIEIHSTTHPEFLLLGKDIIQPIVINAPAEAGLRKWMKVLVIHYKLAKVVSLFIVSDRCGRS